MKDLLVGIGIVMCVVFMVGIMAMILDNITNERTAEERLLLAICRANMTTQDTAGSKTTTFVLFGMSTVTHDGHDYVICKGSDCVSMIHSPSCKCLEVK